MTIKRLILITKRLILVFLTVLAIVQVSLSLIESWGQPQIQSRLELYQTNLLLHAAEWRGEKAGSDTTATSIPDLKTVRDVLLGEKPFKTAQKQYQEVRQSAQNTLNNIRAQLQKPNSQLVAPPEAAKPQLSYPPANESSRSKLQPPQQLQESSKKLERLINELDLRLGILQAQQGETQAALTTWTDLINRSQEQKEYESLAKISGVLVSLWSQPPRLLPDAQQQIQKDLDSWFRYRALTQLYQLQQRQDAFLRLQAQEQQIAQQALLKLAIVVAIPGVGLILGSGLLIFLIAQLLIQGKQSLLAQNAEVSWETPWDGETVWQVFILGFFFVGQILLPFLFSLLNLNPASFDIRGKALYVLFTYLLMTAGGLLVLYLSIKPFFPLPAGWFRFHGSFSWILWGLGGYLVALPLVVVVSLINQKLWQGQGGSNPILPIALEGRDGVALTIFFLTASVAAPAFEELMFRGFLLPSLTRYLPVWGAIAASSFLFAIAHLSLSEVLPLMTLGIILGVVYTRSRNLLASMLLHSLWNSGTLLSLFILGSGSL